MIFVEWSLYSFNMVSSLILDRLIVLNIVDLITMVFEVDDQISLYVRL